MQPTRHSLAIGLLAAVLLHCRSSEEQHASATIANDAARATAAARADAAEPGTPSIDDPRIAAKCAAWERELAQVYERVRACRSNKECTLAGDPFPNLGVVYVGVASGTDELKKVWKTKPDECPTQTGRWATGHKGKCIKRQCRTVWPDGTVGKP